MGVHQHDVFFIVGLTEQYLNHDFIYGFPSLVNWPYLQMTSFYVVYTMTGISHNLCSLTLLSTETHFNISLNISTNTSDHTQFWTEGNCSIAVWFKSKHMYVNMHKNKCLWCTCFETVKTLFTPLRRGVNTAHDHLPLIIIIVF